MVNAFKHAVERVSRSLVHSSVQRSSRLEGWRFGYSALVGGLTVSVGAIALVPSRPVAQALGLAPVYIQLSINRVWGNPTVDLPPQRQRPDLYAEMEILDQRLVTPTEPTPRINEDIYPDWLMSAATERAWLERGHPIPVSVRIFDHDPAEQDDGIDDKVLFSSLAFDPFACEVTVGSESIEGAWVNSRTTCVVSIPDLRSETGSAALTLSAQWIGVSPGR